MAINGGPTVRNVFISLLGLIVFFLIGKNIGSRQTAAIKDEGIQCVEKLANLKVQAVKVIAQSESHEGELLTLLLSYLGLKIENIHLKKQSCPNEENSKRPSAFDPEGRGAPLATQERQRTLPENSVDRIAESRLLKKSKQGPTSSLKSLRELQQTKTSIPPIGVKNIKTYLANAMAVSGENMMVENFNGVLQGRIKISNGEELYLRTKARLYLKGSKYFGNTLVQISNQSGLEISSYENGKNSALRIADSEGPKALIVKIKPRHFLRLEFDSEQNSFYGHFYTLNEKGTNYKLVGEVIELGH